MNNIINETMKKIGNYKIGYDFHNCEYFNIFCERHTVSFRIFIIIISSEPKLIIIFMLKFNFRFKFAQPVWQSWENKCQIWKEKTNAMNLMSIICLKYKHFDCGNSSTHNRKEKKNNTKTFVQIQFQHQYQTVRCMLIEHASVFFLFRFSIICQQFASLLRYNDALSTKQISNFVRAKECNFEKKTTVSISTICLHRRNKKIPSKILVFVQCRCSSPSLVKKKKKPHWRIALKLMMFILNCATNAWLMALLTAWMSTAKKIKRERKKKKKI